MTESGVNTHNECKASEDEGLGEGEAVEDTDDLGDDDAEDVTEDDDNLGKADVDVAAVSGCHGELPSSGWTALF